MLSFLPALKKFASRMMVALVCTTILSAAGVVAVNNMIDSRFDNLKRQEVNVANDTGSGEPANFLLIGSDSRSFAETADDKDSFGAGNEAGTTGQRSDSMMIIHVDPKAKKTTVLAIPRDTLVDIPGIGRKKINASFNTDLGGGPNKVVETIQENFDVPIHHYVEIDFESFRQIVNALGTVNVYFPAPARDHNADNGVNESGLDTKGKSGCLALDGDAALSYVRSRHYQQFVDGKWQSDPTSNFGRIARQQEFMKRVASLSIRKSLTDPLKGRKVTDALLPKIGVDQNFKKDDIFKLMNAFKGVDPNDPSHVLFETLPVKSEFQNGSWNDIVQQEEAELMLEEIRSFSKSTGSSSTTTLPRPSTVKLRVLNGSGEKGLAATTMTNFQSFGFAAAGTGNASSRRATEIHYSANSKSKAQLVAQYVSGKLIQDSAIADADVVVILGSDFKGVSDSTTTTTASKSGSQAKPKVTQTTKPAKNGVVQTDECPA